MFKFKFLVQTALALCYVSMAHAQQTGLLYDPEPPADSAYVRILSPVDGVKMAIFIDGKERVKTLAPGQVSDYLVLDAGQHTVSLHASGKTQEVVSTPLTAPRGGAMTVAFVSVKGSEPPVFFEDKKGNNKLKSMLTVYQLALPATLVDISTSNGKTKVFLGLAYAKLNAIQVNPIKVELKVSKTGDEQTLTTASLDMTQGIAYSVFLLPTTGAGIRSYTIQNSVERFTGKYSQSSIN